MVFDMLATAEPQGRGASRLGDKGIHQCRLADASFARNTHDLPRSPECSGIPSVHLRQFALAPDKGQGLGRAVATGSLCITNQSAQE
jgi:hypothetical protein